MIGEHQPLGLRTSILYFFQAIYLKNTAAQSKLVQTLLPQQGNKGVGISTGQLLCSGFFSTESASARWLSAVALSHGIAGNLQQKEQLLRVQLATSVGNPPISLLKRTSQDLMTISREAQSQNQGSATSRLGLLQFLINWLFECPTAVTHFLQIDVNIPFLLEIVADTQGQRHEGERLVQGLSALLLGECIIFNESTVPAYTPKELIQKINERVGKENFIDKLTSVSQARMFSKIMQKYDAINNITLVSDLLLDRLFCTQVRKLEIQIVSTLENGPNANMSSEETENLIKQISSQKSEIDSLKLKIKELGIDNDNLTNKNQLLEDETNILKATQVENQVEEKEEVSSPDQVSNLIMDLRSQIKSKEAEIFDLKSELERLSEEQENDITASMQLQDRIRSLEEQLQNAGENTEGKIVEKFIEKIVEIEDPEKQTRLDQIRNLEESLKFKEASISQIRQEMNTQTVQLEQEKAKYDKLLKESANNSDSDKIIGLQNELDAKNAEISCLKTDLENKNHETSKITSENDSYKAELSSKSNENLELLTRVTNLENDLQVQKTSKNKSETEITSLNSKISQLELDLETAKEASTLVSAVSNTDTVPKEEFDQLTREQDDLLELLAEQQSKLREYSTRLKNLGEDVTDDDDDLDLSD